MKKTLLYLALAISCHLHGQSDKVIGFGFEVNPSITTQHFDEGLNISASWVPGGSLAGHIYFNLPVGISIRSGLSFHSMNAHIREESILLPCDFTPDGPDQSNSWISSQQSLFYVGIPLAAKVYLSKGQHRPYLLLGSELLLRAAHNDVNSLHECGSEPGTPLINSFLLAEDFLFTGHAGMGIELASQGRRRYYIEPRVMYSLGNSFSLVLDPFFPTQASSFGSRALGFSLGMGMFW